MKAVGRRDLTCDPSHMAALAAKGKIERHMLSQL
jgi:hypothetical protein